jgi:hypothetical protein
MTASVSAASSGRPRSPRSKPISKGLDPGDAVIEAGFAG